MKGILMQPPVLNHCQLKDELMMVRCVYARWFQVNVICNLYVFEEREHNIFQSVFKCLYRPVWFEPRNEMPFWSTTCDVLGSYLV